MNFESHVQMMKYRVLKEVAKLAIASKLEQEKNDIPKKIVAGPKATFRCCIHKEQAIIGERVKLAMGESLKSNSIIEVIDIACDECPIQRFVVTEACRGCLAHKCSKVCPVEAIYYIGQKAYIDTNKCVECGKCKSVCPYNAISDVKRPCIKACHADALSMDQNKKAVIDEEKCIQCGACVYQCPFGAIMDKSYIVEVVEILKQSKRDNTQRVYAVMAPSISSQFTYAKIGQVVSGIKKLGFHNVVEAALGADIIAYYESKEFAETIDNKKIVTSSCCPAFVNYIKKSYPQFIENISESVSPMIAISRLIKATDPKAKVVFIGPCISKKAEIKQKDLTDATDIVITFEELLALFDAMNINLEECEEGVLDNASFFGRIFARSGGVSEAIRHVVQEEKMDIPFNPKICDGLIECDKALKMLRANRLKENFIEGMACQGGCIGGPASLSHGPKDKKEVDEYGSLALETGVKESIRVMNLKGIELKRKKV